jgi:hypothetical protein
VTGGQAAGHGWPEPGDVDGLRDLVISNVLGTRREIEFYDEYIEVLAARVSALEEVLAARWPRRIWVAFRLGRRLRTATRHLGWVGPFADRRKEDASLLVHPGAYGVYRRPR